MKKITWILALLVSSNVVATDLTCDGRAFKLDVENKTLTATWMGPTVSVVLPMQIQDENRYIFYGDYLKTGKTWRLELNRTTLVLKLQVDGILFDTKQCSIVKPQL
jgi:hypothetical protein